MTCKECRFFEPAKNADTGRMLLSVPGRCQWIFPWPSTWPEAYSKLGRYLPSKPCQPETMAWWGENCRTSEAKKNKRNKSMFDVMMRGK